jgi:hypothetical protein
METPASGATSGNDPRTWGPTSAAHARPKPAKSDARPARLAAAAGGLAALSAIAAAIVAPPAPIVQAYVPANDPALAGQTQPTAGGPTDPGSTQVVTEVRYVQLLPGQTPPPGATVVQASGAKPGTVVVTVPNPPATVKKPAPTPIIIKTTQSGKRVP